MKEDFDKLLLLISSAGKPEPKDYKEIFDILSRNSAMQRALCQILLESDERLTQVGRGDLTSDASVKALAKLQGEALGLSNAVETLIELATTKEKENV